MNYQNVEAIERELGLNKSEYFSIEEGKNKVRILSDFVPVGTHFINKKAYPCPLDNTCKLCKKDKKSVRGMMYLYSYNTGNIEVAELPWTVIRKLGEFSQTEDYKFEGAPPYDLVITKEGTGKQTKYDLLPGKNEDPLSEEIMAAYKEMMPIKEFSEKQFKDKWERIRDELSEDTQPQSEPEKIELDDLPF